MRISVCLYWQLDKLFQVFGKHCNSYHLVGQKENESIGLVNNTLKKVTTNGIGCYKLLTNK